MALIHYFPTDKQMELHANSLAAKGKSCGPGKGIVILLSTYFCCNIESSYSNFTLLFWIDEERHFSGNAIIKP